MEELKEDWEELLRAWTCRFEDDGAITVYNDTYYDSREDIILRMTRAYIRACLRNMITQPEHGKWTKLMPAAEWVMASNGVCSMLSRILAKAGGELQMETDKRTNRKGEAVAPGQELSWHEIAGKKSWKGRRQRRVVERWDTLPPSASAWRR